MEPEGLHHMDMGDRRPPWALMKETFLLHLRKYCSLLYQRNMYITHTDIKMEFWKVCLLNKVKDQKGRKIWWLSQELIKYFLNFHLQEKTHGYFAIMENAVIFPGDPIGSKHVFNKCLSIIYFVCHIKKTHRYEFDYSLSPRTLKSN